MPVHRNRSSTNKLWVLFVVGQFFMANANVWVAIAAYNEAGPIGRVVADVRHCGYRVVVVDDGSADATALLAERGGAAVVRHAVNLGQGAALQSGIEFALQQGADVIVTFD